MRNVSSRVLGVRRKPSQPSREVTSSAYSSRNEESVWKAGSHPVMTCAKHENVSVAQVRRRVGDGWREREDWVCTGVATSLTPKQGVAMLRVLVLIGACLFFRAVLSHKPRWSPTATSPYMNAPDGRLSPQQVCSGLDEITPYDSWLQAQRASDPDEAQQLSSPTPTPTEVEECGARRPLQPAPPEP